MLQKFKNVFLLVLILGMGYMLWLDKKQIEILKNIKKIRKGKTTLLIASRVSTVKSLDKILVLNEGKVEAFGTHEECLKNSSTYARMVELQTLEKEMEGK